MTSKLNFSRVSDVLTRKFQGQSFREIHSSYPTISYARIVDIAAQARNNARVWIDEKNRPDSEVADHFGISKACLDDMLVQAREKKVQSDARHEDYLARRELEEEEHFAMMAGNEDFLVDIAVLISDRGMNISEFYDALGCDLKAHRVDADQQIAELSGILKGWETASKKGAE